MINRLATGRNLINEMFFGVVKKNCVSVLLYQKSLLHEEYWGHLTKFLYPKNLQNFSRATTNARIVYLVK